MHGNKKEESIDDAKEKYELYFKNQPETKQFFADVKEAASVNRFTKTLWNRYRWYKFEDADGTTNRKKKAAALRQAGNAVIQGTAADIFKIGVARQFMYIRRNKLFGKLLIVNMIHDEQLLEIDARYLNVQRVLRDIADNMQFEVEGLPPLYIGAGIALSWGKAKDEPAEIHPDLLEELSMEVEKVPIFKEVPEMDVDTAKIVEYFDERNYRFRKQKIIDYITNERNFGKDLHPTIGNMLNKQFNEGRDKGKYNDDADFLLANLEAFIQENGLQVKPEWFNLGNIDINDNGDDDVAYEDEEDNVEVMEDYDERNFTIIEDDKLYGADIVDIIKQFKVCAIKYKRVCGVDTANISRDSLNAICEYLGSKACNPRREWFNAGDICKGR